MRSRYRTSHQVSASSSEPVTVTPICSIFSGRSERGATSKTLAPPLLSAWMLLRAQRARSTSPTQGGHFLVRPRRDLCERAGRVEEPDDVGRFQLRYGEQVLVAVGSARHHSSSPISTASTPSTSASETFTFSLPEVGMFLPT